jgi:hypothetical protein
MSKINPIEFAAYDQQTQINQLVNKVNNDNEYCIRRFANLNERINSIRAEMGIALWLRKVNDNNKEYTKNTTDKFKDGGVIPINQKPPYYGGELTEEDSKVFNEFLKQEINKHNVDEYIENIAKWRDGRWCAEKDIKTALDKKKIELAEWFCELYPIDHRVEKGSYIDKLINEIKKLEKK